jgi:hypothetical protein
MRTVNYVFPIKGRALEIWARIGTATKQLPSMVMAWRVGRVAYAIVELKATGSDLRENGALKGRG